MNKIKKWLEAQGIKFEYIDERVNKYIVIVLEKDCVWINGYGEPMKYDHKITIAQNTYKTYGVSEKTGYSRYESLGHSTRANDIIDILQKRFQQQNELDGQK